MPSLIIIIIAPVLQIVLSLLRVTGRIKIPLGLISFLTLILGIAVSFATMQLTNYSIMQDMPGKKCLDCGMVGISFFIMGFLITVVSVPLIGLASYVFYKMFFRVRDSSGYQPVSKACARMSG